MKKNKIVFIFISFLFLIFSSTQASSEDIKDILDLLKKKYHKANFSVCFKQTSKLKALDIEDRAEGYAYFKYPNSVRWEYYEPEEQIIASDGKKIWIFKKEENQLLVGDATDYFKDGNGISFLSDVNELINNFFIELLEADKLKYILKLVPLKKQSAISEIYIEIERKSFFITKIVNYNAYGDETIISMSDFNFNSKLKDSLFQLKAKKKSDVIKMGNEE